ncbi:MAG: glycosyltransferase family 2 protein [Candidatus Abyssobacteria bacterium SURF_17]|jgi:glycosyltransferase involved in cell wall biosynthesis|uniref:Glycosyltransferase family 2 protein n=1 Tax=Candidatus Abyssobacteria bacterium SURF_17 TaxID=2093361 RepID=A0A419F8L9_9BACT|nr:MAG: glycosyltransferase family 2 protein [Candidatus Abyssubacteria bacterium SURF_17]
MEPYVSVIVPAFNEEMNLRPTVTLVANKLDELKTSFEIIIVNDGSTDRTRPIAEELGQADARIRLINHPRNLGPGSGVFTGIEAGRGEFVIFIPADLALDVNELQKYVDASRTCDLVVGVRSDRRDYSFFRKIVSLVNIALIKLMFGMKERQFNYIHMYRRTMLERMHIESRGVFITAEIMIKARDLGYRLKEVDITYVPRSAGTATCGNPAVIRRAIRDLFLLWWKRTFRRAVYLRPERNAGA